MPAAAGAADADAPARAALGAFVRPGRFTVTLDVSGQTVGKAMFDVRGDRRQDASLAAREAWQTALDSIATLARAAAALDKRVSTATDAAGRERAATVAELRARLSALYQALEPQIGAPSADMRAQLASYSGLLARLDRDTK